MQLNIQREKNNLQGLSKYDWIHEDINMQSLHRIYPIFNEGLVLFDRYNYRLDIVDNSI